jgi:hypothetical protein
MMVTLVSFILPSLSGVSLYLFNRVVVSLFHHGLILDYEQKSREGIADHRETS